MIKKKQKKTPISFPLVNTWQSVNARAMRQTSDGQSDVLDCQCIRQLLSYGLLKGSFHPPMKFVRRATWSVLMYRYLQRIFECVSACPNSASHGAHIKVLP